jgi:hypothetical protein
MINDNQATSAPALKAYARWTPISLSEAIRLTV